LDDFKFLDVYVNQNKYIELRKVGLCTFKMQPLHTSSASIRAEELPASERINRNNAILSYYSRPYDDTEQLWDARFVLLDQGQFQKAFNFAVQNANFRAAVDIIQNEITRGGLHIQKGEGTKQLRAEEIDSQIPWLNHAVTILMDFFMYGISLWQVVTLDSDCSTDKKQRRPQRLDPLKINVYFYAPPAGPPLFHCRMPPNLMEDGTVFPANTKGGGHKRDKQGRLSMQDDDDQRTAFKGRELYDVMVFWRNPMDLPDPMTSQLRSRVMTLVDKYSKLEILQHALVEAAIRAANPPLVTERNPDKQGGMGDIGVMGIAPYGDVLQLGPNGANISALDAEIRKEALISHAMHIKDTRTTTSEWMNYIHAANLLGKGRAGPAGQRIDLPDERKVAKTDKPEGPKDLVKYELNAEAMTFQLLGIPPGMVMAEHTSGKQGAGNVNAEAIYRKNVHAIKDSILGPLKIMYKRVYQEERAKVIIKAALKHKDKLASKKQPSKTNKKRKRSEMEDSESDNEDDDDSFERAVRKETGIEFILPSIPSLEEIKEVMALGILKEEFMPEYIHMNMGIPRAHLHTKPKTKREDVLTEGKMMLQKEQGKQQAKQSEIDHKNTVSEGKQQSQMAEKDHKHTMESGKMSMEQEKLKMQHTKLKMKAQAQAAKTKGKSKPKTAKKKKKATAAK
jgi:hypothetical protein